MAIEKERTLLIDGIFTFYSHEICFDIACTFLFLVLFQIETVNQHFMKINSKFFSTEKSPTMLV